MARRTSSGRGTAYAQELGEFTAGQILVKFKPDTRLKVIADIHRQYGGIVQALIPRIDVQVVRVPAGQEALAIAAYLSNPHVQFAEVNGFYYALAHGTKDPLVGQQW